jgi:hypothetical protein
MTDDLDDLTDEERDRREAEFLEALSRQAGEFITELLVRGFNGKLPVTTSGSGAAYRAWLQRRLRDDCSCPGRAEPAKGPQVPLSNAERIGAIAPAVVARRCRWQARPAACPIRRAI